MRILIATLIAVLSLGAPGLAGANQGSAQDRLQAAAAVVENVQTMRFVGYSNVTPSATGESIRVFNGSGEFQAPDRSRMIIEQPQLLQVTETIQVGPQAWMKTVDGSAWVPITAGPAAPAPKGVADLLREISRYLVSPSVTDGDAQSIVAADVDLARAIDDDSNVPSMMGIYMAGDNATSTQVNSAGVSITLDRATNYPVLLTTSLTMVPSAPMEGIPAGPITVSTSLSLSDFNTEIVVPIPGG